MNWYASFAMFCSYETIETFFKLSPVESELGMKAFSLQAVRSHGCIG
ncbi:hypothetical protein FHX77_000950 [Bifidobacterium commune]|uniref:Uncharacterized protein n=1 Tax=Bifidobacterium commune TaxID=1505727 RepID=A0A1C4H5T2_9BIFI|nr:hypothetical protein [Bifidobacterium commune]SCC80000.1 hypothetical protein GA0061077_0922 [Bifidobacterium commune]